MASRLRIYEQKKLLGQIYTPAYIVDKILEHTGFYKNFGNKKILDPACGDGRFLVPVVKFIVANSPADSLHENLLHIHGWDIDPEALKLCRQNLDEALDGLDLKIDWKLENNDALRQLKKGIKFDLIVGNPPYIRIQHLPGAQRKYIQNAYSFCKNGSTDAYMAFFQLGSHLLTSKGVCGFITPNSYFYSETAKVMRSFFEENQNLIHITNFGTAQIFENTGTYTAITVFGKSGKPTFYYEKLSDDQRTYAGRNVSHQELNSHMPWQLSVEERNNVKGTRLGDLCKISIGISTLADGYYLFTLREENGNLALAVNRKGDAHWLEKEILKPIVKGSKLKTSSDPIQEYIVFPYQKDESGKNRIIPEACLKSKFPFAYDYLKSIKPQLLKRDNGKPNAVEWYALGRAQGLDHSFGRKIIFSPINVSPNFVLYDNPDCTVYSGYFIKYDGDYDKLLAQLNSKRMADFIQSAGRDFQGGYKGYNKKVLENFIITD